MGVARMDKGKIDKLHFNLMGTDSNPEDGGSARVADVHFSRILNKSLFNLIWKSMFTGIKETIGLKK
jgi:hypothetical protein